MMRVATPETLNAIEVIQVRDWMDKNNPNIHYTVRSGNGCVWVSWGSTTPINLYFVFREGKIFDVQVD